MREPRQNRLPPLKASALAALESGELYYTPDVGWKRVDGRTGLWNSHTISWFAGQRYCTISNKRARITAEGRSAALRQWA